ncbi:MULTISPECIES: hypothetical protein [Methylosinus]|uniref:Uncharacterized protein n=1 Tax=Methylosinus trichosporium (strain ATCC 35070 / NCIMB 11131 / UNIQEM 75 / OB3b) TaxID=595536 RepID=A0A2D2CYJ8_METT3|nr:MULTISPECIES: hypothetical protein [Methylosinus]ATQ67786.1 hypothetical protein CQW49_07680 [Methylosinus trichosporium OB3b]OBS51807.1 hypothetical protein A8B73_14200 [Methylosinus sp. 3S-1]
MTDILARVDGSYDRRAIMALALLEYREVGGRSFGECQRWAWEQARKERALRAEGRAIELRRLRDMRAHRISHHRARRSVPLVEAA